MPGRTDTERFEQLMLPHLDAAYSLAWWLCRNDELANDIVQEAYLRALKFFGSFCGEEGRPWLLRIVRKACYEMRGREQARGDPEAFDEALHPGEAPAAGAVLVLPVNPEAAAIARADRELVRQCLDALPHEFRGRSAPRPGRDKGGLPHLLERAAGRRASQPSVCATTRLCAGRWKTSASSRARAWCLPGSPRSGVCSRARVTFTCGSKPRVSTEEEAQ